MAKKRLIFILLVLVAVVLIYLPGFSKLQQLREENRILREKIDALAKTNRELKKEKEKLEKDPSYIEKIAREKLGMAKEGEIILK